VSDQHFRKHPRPDPDVVELLERVLASARLGYVRAITIVAVNPINEVETPSAGEVDLTRLTALQGGLLRAAIELMNIPRKG
jgi:hypothetical protein